MKKVLFLLVLIFSFVLTGCLTTSSPVDFTIQKKNYSLEVGDEVKLILVIANLTENPRYNFVTSDANIATVDQRGSDFYLVATGVGETTVRVDLLNIRGKSVTLTVVVTEPDLLAISIDGDSEITVEIGDVVTFTTSTNITYEGTVLWNSSDEVIGTISSSGVFDALSVGITIITATAEDSFDDVTVNVVEKVIVEEISEITISGPTTVLEGEMITLTVDPDVAIPFSVNWTSLDTSKATVDATTGEVTGVAAGGVTIMATLVGNSSVYDIFSVTVEEVVEIIPPTGIILSGSSEMITGEEVVFTVAIEPVGATGSVLFETSDITIADVDDTSGLVTAIAEGSVTITASLVDNPSIADSITVVVIVGVPDLTSISISGPNEVQVGETITLTAIPTPSGANGEVTWMSLTPSRATVNVTTGLVTGVAEGVVSIVATSVENTQIIQTHSITVTAGPYIEVTAGQETVYIGETIFVSAIVYNTTNDDVIYSSSNQLVATVNETTGEVTGVSVGTTTIIATSVTYPSLVDTVDC